MSSNEERTWTVGYQHGYEDDAIEDISRLVDYGILSHDKEGDMFLVVATEDQAVEIEDLWVVQFVEEGEQGNFDEDAGA